MKIVHKADYAKLRVREYPPLSEFADAMYWNARGDRTKLDAYFEKIDAVKTRFPKLNEQAAG